MSYVIFLILILISKHDQQNGLHDPQNVPGGYNHLAHGPRPLENESGPDSTPSTYTDGSKTDEGVRAGLYCTDPEIRLS